MKKILCAVDGSEHSHHAVALASQFAKALGAELTLLVVNELIDTIGPKGGTGAYFWDSEQLQGILDEAAGIARDSGVSNSKKVSINSRDVARAIALFAEENGFDHVVVGSAGKGGVSRLMLGSVSRDVVFRVHCPVTVVR